jgi:hypothetical protein
MKTQGRKWRRPRMKDGRVEVYFGVVDGHRPDWCVIWGEGTARCDARFVLSHIADPISYSILKDKETFVAELESRGYDLSTLRFTIDKKAPEGG